MTAPEQLSVILRALVYASSIAVAGGVLFRWSFPVAAAAIRPALQRQIVGGFLLLLLIEPMRYAAFQFAIGGGDWSVAFGPELRWMGFETPIGKAAAVRLAAAAVIVIAGRRSAVLSLAAALVMIAAFLLEGHTAASDAPVVLSAFLLLHLAAVHWWLGALFALIAVTRLAEPATVVATIETFGRRAMWVVGALVAAGAALAFVVTGGTLNVDSAYQQRLLIKLILVAALLSLAALNKLRLTPLLRRDFDLGARRLRTSIRVEIAVAALILCATAWLVATGPDT